MCTVRLSVVVYGHVYSDDDDDGCDVNHWGTGSGQAWPTAERHQPVEDSRVYGWTGWGNGLGQRAGA